MACSRNITFSGGGGWGIKTNLEYEITVKDRQNVKFKRVKQNEKITLELLQVYVNTPVTISTPVNKHSMSGKCGKEYCEYSV